MIASVTPLKDSSLVKAVGETAVVILFPSLLTIIPESEAYLLYRGLLAGL